jgi:hypothetical protein
VTSDQAGRDAMLATAAEVVRQHLPDADGWCLGCLTFWGRLVFIEQCTQLKWASAVQAIYGSGNRPPSVD